MAPTSVLFSAKHTSSSSERKEALKPQDEAPAFNQKACIEAEGSKELLDLQEKVQRWWKRYLKKHHRFLVK